MSDTSTIDEADKSALANVQQLVTQASSKDPQVQYAAVFAVRKLLISSNTNSVPPIDPLINCGILPILVDCLGRSSDPSLQIQAAWALTNITSGTPVQTQAVVAAGAVPMLLELLGSEDQNVCEHAVWALGNIIGESAQFRDHVISLGFVPKLLNFIKADIPTSFLRNLAWVIVNLCRCNVSRSPPTIGTLRDVLPALLVLVHHPDTNVVVEAVYGIKFVMNAGNETRQMVVESGVLPKLVSLLSNLEYKVQTAALQTFGNMAVGTDEQKQAVLNCDALKHSIALLAHPRTRRRAAWAISRFMIHGNKKQLEYLVNIDVIPSFCNLLTCVDQQVIQIVLDGIYNILKMSSSGVTKKASFIIAGCGGLDKIKSFQNHLDIDINVAASKIIKKYFT